MSAGWWIDLPSSGGPADRFGADEPGGAGTLQIAASNARLAARENGLRTLFEDFGSSNVFGDLPIPGLPQSFDWRAEDASGVWVRHAGIFRVRLWGETTRVPRIHLACRALAPAGEQLGIILAVARGLVLPDASAPFATATTDATSPTLLSVDLTLEPDDLVSEALTLQSEAAPVSEAGTYTTVSLWIGAWCTSAFAGAKGALYGVSVLLREPI